MNYKTRMARYASMASSDFFLYKFFRNKKLTEEGIISSISPTGYNTLVKKYGLEGFIEFTEEELLKN